MADQAPNEAEAPPERQGAKKELTSEQLKSYIQKARAKIRKLEDENKSLVTKVEEAHTLCAARDAGEIEVLSAFTTTVLDAPKLDMPVVGNGLLVCSGSLFVLH